jgi:cytochrome c-type biogenesis protein CcsB
MNAPPPLNHKRSLHAAAPRIATHWIIAALAGLILMTTSPRVIAAAAAPSPALWNEALEPLNAMPIQEEGYIRSAYSFGGYQLLSISGKSSYNGMNGLTAIVWLIAHPAAANDAQLIKLGHPELIQLFGGKRVSRAQLNDPDTLHQLNNLWESDKDKWETPIGQLQSKVRRLEIESLEHAFAIIPRPGEWLTPHDLMHDPSRIEPGDQVIIDNWGSLKQAIADNDLTAGEAAAQALADSVTDVAHNRGVELPRLELDAFYHIHRPYAKSAVFYLFSALFLGAALMFTRRPWVTWIGYGLLALGLAEQVVGITSRWVLAGRPPNSNMYESFTFAVAGMVVIAVIFEAIHRSRIVGTGAAVLGFIFMVLAHNAPIFNSRISPLMPALQSTWLIYHVITILLSYSAFALSFFVSFFYIVKDFAADKNSGWAGRLPSLERLDVLNYKIIIVGFPLLTLGIILGAIWAATAWGRPWGFDPKETWALITWLIYAIYLHGRHLAGWRGRQAAWISLLGFACVVFTYLGVNFVLSGLHSYA